jgi:hypothetical protein
MTPLLPVDCLTPMPQLPDLFCFSSQSVYDPWTSHKVSAGTSRALVSFQENAMLGFKSLSFSHPLGGLQRLPDLSSLYPWSYHYATKRRLGNWHNAHGAAPEAALSSPEPECCALSQNGYGLKCELANTCFRCSPIHTPRGRLCLRSEQNHR